MDSDKFRITTFFLVLAFAIGLCFLLIKPFLYITAWSIIITVVSYPLYKRLLKKNINPQLSALLTCLTVVGIVILPVIFAFSYAIYEGIDFIDSLKEVINSAEPIAYVESTKNPIIIKTYNFLKNYTSFFNVDIKFLIKEKIGFISSFCVQQSINIVQNIITEIVQLIIILFTTFFLLTDFNKLLDLVKAFIPLEKDQTSILINKISETIYTTVYVALIVALVQGTLGGLAFWFLGLKSPLLWGIVMAIFCLIPLVGHPVVWIPAVLLLLLQGLYFKALVLVLWGMLVIGLIDNFIRTILIGSRSELHPLIVFFSVFGGVLLLGPIGLLLGPVIVVVTSFLLDILKVKLRT